VSEESDQRTLSKNLIASLCGGDTKKRAVTLVIKSSSTTTVLIEAECDGDNIGIPREIQSNNVKIWNKN
jgi:hypothetical protein